MKVFLSGLMGTGKSTLGKLVAKRLGWSFVDLDHEIVARVQKSVAEIFQEEGEASFRNYERTIILELVDKEGDVVIALGGGTVVDSEVRAQLLKKGVVVTLTAPLSALVQRIGANQTRPLLHGHDAYERLKHLYDVRKAVYAEAHARFDTTCYSKSALVDHITSLVKSPPIVVPLGERSYQVVVGSGARHDIRSALDSHGVSETVVLVTDTNVLELWGHEIAQHLRQSGREVIVVTLDPGEWNKNLRSVETIWNRALQTDIDRNSAIVAVGGGVIGDLAGFAASTVLRGIKFFQVPTTLLSMVDSSVGGKTGFDTAEGKNLIGTFYQPSFVCCDVDVLRTLSRRDRISGIAEVIKAAWLDSEEAVTTLEHEAKALVEGSGTATTNAIQMAVSLKARIVSEDEHETKGRRMLLNLGHTVGHAIEAAAQYTGIQHGEAVALGMIAASRIGKALGKTQPETATRLQTLIDAVGLPTNLDSYLSEHVKTYIGADKKRRGHDIRFVIPIAPGVTEIIPVKISDIVPLVIKGR